MFFNQAFAADTENSPPQATTAITQVPPAGSNAQIGSDAMLMNVGMVLVLAALFYVLLIRPQQKRFKEHSAMISHLDKGTKVVTQGGLVGTIDKNVSDNEVVLDFGNNVKISMLRSYIIGRYDDTIIPPANDDSKNKKDTSTK